MALVESPLVTAALAATKARLEIDIAVLLLDLSRRKSIRSDECEYLPNRKLQIHFP